ncbi:oligosaccharide flippase family protein [Plesiomonas shigelloides]|uniref:Putative O-antigen transporter n=1 Tax=Plesiomonas shigelloides TaxID=703 RepID=A0A4D6U7L7_PLESH|nr:oligosaccharide flippase family protein [Plesiomonas shigelloides]KAB7688485.1 oligosaccharide flippase family protein [Plesiomonas shigelloides]QCH03230.1 O166 family O-antigen flippase [Plesiomonas shigelloides]
MLVEKILTHYKKNNDIVNNILFLCVEKVFVFIMVFYVEAMISRALGIENYGKWLYAVNLILVISSLTLVAGSEVVVPALARVKNVQLQWDILTGAFIIRMALSVVTFIGIYVYICFFIHDESLKLMLKPLAFVLLLIEPFGVITNYYQSKIRSWPIVLARLFALFIRCVVVSFAVWVGHDVAIYFCRSIEALVLALILSVLILRCGYKCVVSPRVINKIFIRGLKLWAPLILMLIYMRVDRFFVENYLGYKELASYGVAAQVMEQLMLLVSIVIMSIGPKLIFKKLSIDKRKVVLLISLITIPIQIFAAFSLPFFIGRVFGSDYDNSAIMAIKMLPALFFYAIDMVYMQYIYKNRLYHVVFIKWALMLLICMASYYFWLSVMGRKDIAPVFVFNYICMLVVTILVSRIRKVN